MTITSDELAGEIVELINEELTLDPSVVVEADTDLLETETVDSLGVVEIVAWLEERLETKVAPADVTFENFGTVRRMADFGVSLLA